MFRRFQAADYAALILRLMLASIFITQGWMMIDDFEGGTTWYRGAGSIDPALQATVAWSELVCGIVLALGLLTRLASVGLIAIMIGAVYMVTWTVVGPPASFNDKRGFIVYEVGYEYNFAIVAMAACLVILGAGAFSIDRLLWGRRATATTPAELAGATRV